MDILKEVILVLFVFLFNLLFPILGQMLDPQKRNVAVSAYPNFAWILVFQILFTLILLVSIHWINKLEKKRDDERLKKILREVMEAKNPMISFGGKGGKRKHGK